MKTPRAFVRIVGLAAIALAGLFWASSCATTDQLAPPVDDQMINLAARDGLAADSLQRGRHIYVTRCATCHSPEPIDRYAASEWPGIVRRMVDRTGLDEAETSDLVHYVTAARRASDRP